ncbi:MAG: hypothetical protein HY644_06325 [Acidobacteria bacterium]|nr:hypothetical protein [Acidobacteriota bacterium]
MKKLVAVSMFLLLVFTVFTIADQQKGAWTGWISDSHCGAKGANAKHADCGAKCLAGGEKAVLVVGSDVYSVANQDAVKDHMAHQVKVTGTLDQDKKVVTVEKVEMAGEKKM